MAFDGQRAKNIGAGELQTFATAGTNDDKPGWMGYAHIQFL